jgi:3-oxoacyl-[acyl-carrier protein] reductase
MIDLTGRVALVTGGSRGIGRAIALALANAGAAVAVNYHEREGLAVELVESIRAGGRRAIAVGADVSSRPAVEAMVRQVEAELGSIGVLINNAGVAAVRGLDDLTEEDFDRTIAINLKSAFLCTSAVLPGMRASRWGRIVNISSVAARGGGAIGVHYNASKAGLEGLTRGYASRLAAEGVTVNAVAPGLIDTSMARDTIAERGEAYKREIPLQRYGHPSEVATVIRFLCSTDASYVTGQTITIDGGITNA